ncbi:starch synthase 3, chloroplastic/amyloplastic isoform X2 [Asparagus officinalis]|uniref:starch synthase 3, chloroplastic/amyloplastic isoform X2 n=1 Tax=Asparagus officinalis TaxID=4686 RepID=UPI00098DE472|nr:starch synthase 3, chloroplastic/amyloplastic isoform X2 [Asparagus officinalis]
MEMSLQPKSSLFGTYLGIKPALTPSFSKSLLGLQEFRRNKATICLASSSDSPRRRPRKSAIPKIKPPARKGFAPKPQVGTSRPKKDQSDIKEKIDLQSSISSNSVKKGVEVLEKVEEEEDTDITSDDEASVVTSADISNGTSRPKKEQSDIEEKIDLQSSISSNSVKKGVEVLEKVGEEEDTDITSDDEASVVTSADFSNGQPDSRLNQVKIEGRAHTTEFDSRTSRIGGSSKLNEIDCVEHQISKMEITKGHTLVTDSIEGDEATVESDININENEEEQIDAQAQRNSLELLADQNYASGKKVFVFPEVVKASKNVEIFLNRSSSALVNENEVLINGAFNGWKWKSFTEKMHKTDLKGDWWSCQLYVPKEAYRMDFVFFNGENVYENNNLKDFFLTVESEFDESSFEDFLLEEKRKELERIAEERAERERLAEELREREAEKAASEADLAQAKMEVQKKREAVSQVMKFSHESVDDLWHIEATVFKGENRVRLYYNRSARPLEHVSEVWIHGGYNNWADGLTIVERLQRSEKKDGDWWYAEVVIPDRALVLDWVFADGPPRSATVYDNNNYLDYHAIVPNVLSEELFWVEEEHRIYRKLQEERKQKQEAAQRKAEKTAQLKAETRERSMKSGPLPPKRMEPAQNGTHLKATVKVPMDAYTLDFVFSEREDGGIYDNKSGMDYHIPVVGGTIKEPPMHVVHIAVEMAPIAKVGGLGDVVTSLSRAVQELGHKVDIIFPKYDCMNLSNVKDFHFRQSFFWGGTEIKVWFGKVEGLSVYFLEPQNGMFWAGCIYGRNDGDRFGFFCHAALEFLLQIGVHPDILHCHDWSSAPVAWLFKEHYRHYGMNKARIVFTIHNLEFGAGHIAKAMQHADKATTVSRTYSKEVSGNPAISPHLYKFHGILNGIDPDIWDPYNDNFIPVAYTSENVVEGKKAAKEALQQRLGLNKSDQPLVGIITRLTVQKGIHLIKHAIWRALDRGGQVVLLGSAPDPRIQNDFVNLANQLHSSHGDRARLVLTYDEPLSHLIYAGSDFILVPSIFEPCGLTQLVAMRYGAIPVVRKTGGLYDTVYDVDNDKERAQAQGLEPNGFSFDGADTAGVDYALNRAISAWYDAREWFNSLCKRVMEQDWSWNRPALDYMELYHAARK